MENALPAKGYGENVVWIITEADRSVTTVLLPEEVLKKDLTCTYVVGTN